MGEDNGLQILIEAALDFEKSLNTMTTQMNQMRDRFKDYTIKITAGLNQTASAAQIKSDLKSINQGKNRVRLTGEMDREETKKNVTKTIKGLKQAEIKIAGVLDASATTKNIQQQFKQIPDVSAKAEVNVDGAEQVDKLASNMDKAGKSAANMAGQIYVARTALAALRRAAQEAAQTVVELDKAATDLALVTGDSSGDAYTLLNEYNEMAQQLGATTTQISDAATEWLRQGKTAAETTALIEQSMVLSKVGAMESAEATKNLTSAMKGYGLTVEDVSGIVDKLTAIDLKAAVTASDLAVAMSRTANSANISGVSMDRLLGYLATVEEVTQKSAETIGESFKTIFARMGNIKLGNYMDDDGEDLSDVETVLKNFGIALRDSEGDFRDFSIVLDEVYAKWEQFSGVDKRAVANAFAGTRQQENFLVLMENYGKALEYAGVAADSAGTAMEKFTAYEDSIGAKAATFTAAMESLTMDTVDPEFVKDLIEAGTAVVEFAEKAGLLKINLTSGNFEGTEYTYEAKEIGLDDFIADLELDISTYEDAIAQIDGQIATLQALKNIPLKEFKSDSGSDSGSGSDEVEEYIADIDKYREAVERLRKTQELVSDIELKIEDSDNIKEKILLTRQLIGAYEREQDALHDLNNERDATIQAGVESLRELGFAVEYNADTNDLWISNMEHLNELTADSVGSYGSMQEATNALREDTEGLIDTITELNEENREGSESWKEVESGIKSLREQITDYLSEIVQEASDSVDSIQSVYDTLHEAADEYASSGYIAIDTLQKINDLGQQYLAYLMDENGQLVINEERIQAIIAARTQQMAIESSLAYVEALRMAKAEGDIATLNNLLYATEQATNATWGFVYANLALAGLDDAQYQAALQNINALRSLAESAVQSIGQTVGGVTEELEEMQNGLNDILDYVMDMLKQRIQDQIDGLEDMKDAYSEIIELKKESLEASKDEADYQKTMASKMREIAKLQARIDALSLDDSREAQAEKAALLEEMSELQQELADDQADRTLEAQEDALDKMEEAYHEEKDKEIEILEDSISSYQKLYDI